MLDTHINAIVIYPILQNHYILITLIGQNRYTISPVRKAERRIVNQQNIINVSVFEYSFIN